MSHNSMLSLEQLCQNYPSSQFSLGPINLEISEGQCIGVMGENGAGKTTLFPMITGNSKAASGKYSCREKVSPEKYQLKKDIGYLPQNLELPKWVSGHEIISYSISLYGLEDPDNLRQKTLEYWVCLDFAHKPLAACSHGMKKKSRLRAGNRTQ